MIKLNQITKLVLALVLIAGAANLVFTNILASGGQELASLHQEILTLQKDNHYLKTQIAQNASLAHLESRARDLGFVQIGATIAITTPAPVAYVAQ